MLDFNTAGPVRADQHYCIPPLDRLNLRELLALIRKERYFVLHAPRQTGKTSALLTLRDLLNTGAEGDYRCVYVNVEPAQTAREDVARAMRNILNGISRQARMTVGDAAAGEIARSLDVVGDPDGALGEFLALWCEADPKPLVLLIDEIDALVGDSLISVLRQLRAGYPHRPERFPQTVVLCGVRDVRDYRIHASSEKQVIAGGSAFNIKAKSLRLGDFTETEVRSLLGQHTEATGQEFAPEAVDAVWEQTRGQPWLVNALAREMCFEHEELRLRDHPVSESEVYDARETLILRRETHLDQLTDKLREPRVRRVIEPLLSGGRAKYTPRDFEYVRDLGLVAPDPPLRIANPIYGEVLPRELTWVLEHEMQPQTAWYVNPDGSLNLEKLLAAFQEFFRENSEHWVERAQYKEAGPQLVLQAFLHRVVNGAGRIEREYALGSRRVDLLIIWPSRDGIGQPVRRGMQAAERQSRPDYREGAGADGGVHGPLRGGRRTSGGLRCAIRAELGGQGLPGRAGPGGEADYSVGDVRASHRSPPSRKVAALQIPEAAAHAVPGAPTPATHRLCLPHMIAILTIM